MMGTSKLSLKLFQKNERIPVSFSGELAEWPKALAWKAGNWGTGSGVRISHSPPDNRKLLNQNHLDKKNEQKQTAKKSIKS